MAYKKNANRDIKSRFLLASINVIQTCSSYHVTDREKEMVKMFVAEERSFDEIAAHFQLTRQRVDRIIRGVLAHMEKMNPKENYYLEYLRISEERDQLRQELNSLRYAKKRISKDYEPEEHYDGVLLSDCELSTRVLKAFDTYHPEIKSVEQLSRYSKKQLLKMPKFGIFSINEIEVLLAKFGYQLLP